MQNVSCEFQILIFVKGLLLLISIFFNHLLFKIRVEDQFNLKINENLTKLFNLCVGLRILVTLFLWAIEMAFTVRGQDNDIVGHLK